VNLVELNLIHVTGTLPVEIARRAALVQVAKSSGAVEAEDNAPKSLTVKPDVATDEPFAACSVKSL